MAIVARGLGQPEDGSLVAGGLGTTEPDLNAMVASLSGSGTITATLTATTTVVATGGHSGKWDGILQPPRRRQTVAAFMSADLHGSSRLHAEITFSANFDDLDFEVLLLAGSI